MATIFSRSGSGHQASSRAASNPRAACKTGSKEVAVDAFNALNRANVHEVTSVYGTYNFCIGQVRVHDKDAAPIAIEKLENVGGCPAAGPLVPNPLFGDPRTMFNPRHLQFSLKYSF
jgi:hypothetical protein